MKIYCLQFDIAWHDKLANFEKVRLLLSAAKPEKGSLVLLPEMFATGFSMDVPAIAEPARGPTHDFLARLAQDFAITLIAGVVRTGPDGQGRNRALVLSATGELLADYAKLHPFTFGGESKHYRAGDSLALFPWQNATILPAICYDLRFPELFRAGIQAGAQIITLIANWPAARESHWLALLTARAIENQCYVAACNRCGKDPNTSYCGRSVIIDPHGNLLADAGAAEMPISAEVDLAALRHYREEFPALTDMRADLLPPPRLKK